MAKDAVIIGGSNAGLMHGIMLKHNGYNVTILEQSNRLARAGYDAGISVGPDVKDFLAKHDDVKRPFALKCSPGVKFNIQGDPTSKTAGQVMTNTSWGLFIKILRANYDGLASDAVPNPPAPRDRDGEVVYRDAVHAIDLEEVDGRVRVSYEETSDKQKGHVSADLVVVADGSFSTMRKTLMPGARRNYLGYMCWRGTVKECAIKEEWNKLHANKATFHLMKRSYILCYTIPSDAGGVEQEDRLYNWIWYSNLSNEDANMKALFTDIHGQEHQGTVPRGLIQPEEWEKQKAHAQATLPDSLAAIICGAAQPFVTKVYEVPPTKALFHNGKVFVVGDAQTTIRPNAGISTTKVAHDCNNLEHVIQGTMTPQQWEKKVLRFAAAKQSFSTVISNLGLRSKLAFAWSLCGFVWLLLRQKLRMA